MNTLIWLPAVGWWSEEPNVAVGLCARMDDYFGQRPRPGCFQKPTQNSLSLKGGVWPTVGVRYAVFKTPVTPAYPRHAPAGIIFDGEERILRRLLRFTRQGLPFLASTWQQNCQSLGNFGSECFRFQSVMQRTPTCYSRTMGKYR